MIQTKLERDGEAALIRLQERLDENPCELEDYIEEYADETGAAPVVDRARRFERGIELTDADFREWLVAHLVREEQDVMADIERVFEGDQIRCWRVLTAPADWTPTSPNCGVHWSRDRACAERFRADISDGSPEHMVEAIIPLASIDWDATLSLNLSREFGDEAEIRIRHDAPVNVVAHTVMETYGIRPTP